MLQAIIRWLADHLGIALINWAHPELKKQIDDLLAARDAQAVKDKQTEAEVAQIEKGVEQTETKVVAREAEIAADQKVIADDASRIEAIHQQVKEAKDLDEIVGFPEKR